MTNLLERKDVFVCGITNVFAIAIVVDDDTETVKYQYHGGNITEPLEAKICYDSSEDIEPYFETIEGARYYLREFMRRH